MPTPAVPEWKVLIEAYEDMTPAQRLQAQTKYTLTSHMAKVSPCSCGQALVCMFMALAGICRSQVADRCMLQIAGWFCPRLLLLHVLSLYAAHGVVRPSFAARHLCYAMSLNLKTALLPSCLSAVHFL